MTTTTIQEAGPSLASAELGDRVLAALHAENAPRAPGSPYTASAASVIALRAEDAHPAWHRGPRRVYGEPQDAKTLPVRIPLDGSPITWPDRERVPTPLADQWIRQTKVRPSLTFEDAAPNHDGVLTTDPKQPKTPKGRSPKAAPRYQFTVTFGGKLR